MKILVAIFSDVLSWTISDEGVAHLRARAPHTGVVHARTDADVLAAIADADVAFTTRLDARAVARAARLRWIQTPAAGIDPTLLDGVLRKRDVVLTNSRGVNAQPVAEHAITLALALARRVHTAIARQASANWAQNELTVPPPRLLQGLTLGVVGLGAIGTTVARLGRAFGMRIVATRRHASQRSRDVDALYPAEQIDRLLAESDVVILAVPETRETTHLIGARELALMRPDALLINVGRGSLVDEAALVDALITGRLGGAGLDVFSDEPLPASSPLWTLPNVIVTPHVAGVLPDHWTVAVDMFVDNLRRFEAGEPLLNLVDKDAGY